MSKRSFHVILALIVGLMFVFGDAFLLCAQEANSEEFTLEEITVTAQKRAEDQQKVPIAMDVITGDRLTEMGKTNVNDILTGISTVMVNNSTDGMRVSIRGLTEYEEPSNGMHASMPAVAINIDGAYNSSSSAGQNLFDIERVEVLYGPQSTMYASTSPGGIVNVVTAAPKTDKYSANASIEAGNFGLKNIQFAGNAPIVKDLLAMRLAAQVYNRDPFVSGSSDIATDTKSARLKTLFQPNDNFSATVTVNYTKRTNGGQLGGQVQIFDYQDGHWYTSGGGMGATVWTKDGKVTDPWKAGAESAGPGRYPSGPNQGDQTTKGITGEIDWDTGIGNLSVVPQYSKSNEADHGNYTDLGEQWTVWTEMKGTQKGVEARMTSSADFFFKWIAGFNYYKSNESRSQTYNEPGATNQTFILSSENKAAFANVTYPFTDKFRGNAGYRRTWDKAASIMKPSLGMGTEGQNYSKPDYSFGIEYDLAENSMLYANYSTSYRMWFHSNNQGPRTMPPEQLKSYSVGVKNRFLQNTLQLNASAYYYNYANKMAEMTDEGRIGQDAVVYEDELADPDGNPVDVNGNDVYGEHVQITGMSGQDPWYGQWGAFSTIGADVSAEWLATSKDRVTLNISYLDAKWSDLTIVYYWQKASAYGGGHFWSTDGKNYDGVTNTYSPKWTITASYEHNFMLGSYGILLPHIDAQYKSSYIMDPKTTNYPMAYQEPYYIYNGSVTFTHSSGIWSLNAYVKNATNYAAKTFWVRLQSSNFGINDPRIYGAILSVKF
jgi:iron complex outermembrane recepter protein